MMKFALGQRWISDSESDLGLGTVVGIEGRMLTLLFPASGETRLYAIAEAPLTRVQFNPGDTIKSAEGFSLVVANIEEKNQTLVYHGHRTDDGEAVSLRETFLDHFISYFDKILPINVYYLTAVGLTIASYKLVVVHT